MVFSKSLEIREKATNKYHDELYKQVAKLIRTAETKELKKQYQHIQNNLYQLTGNIIALSNK